MNCFEEARYFSIYIPDTKKDTATTGTYENNIITRHTQCIWLLTTIPITPMSNPRAVRAKDTIAPVFSSIPTNRYTSMWPAKLSKTRSPNI